MILMMTTIKCLECFITLWNRTLQMGQVVQMLRPGALHKCSSTFEPFKLEYFNTITSLSTIRISWNCSKKPRAENEAHEAIWIATGTALVW